MFEIKFDKISWTSIGFHYFRGHTTIISTSFLKKLASSAVNVHFFRGIQIFFPRTTTTKITTITTTNKPFLRPRQRSLVVKKYLLTKHNGAGLLLDRVTKTGRILKSTDP